MACCKAQAQREECYAWLLGFLFVPAIGHQLCILSSQRLDLDRQHRWQVPYNRLPTVPPVS